MIVKVEKTYGQAAYAGYAAASGGKSLASGEKLPGWEDLKSEIRDAWECAANLVLEMVATRVMS